MCLDRRLKNRPFSGMESTMFTFASRTFVIAMAAALIGRSLTASDVVDKIDDALLGKLQGEWSPTSSVFDGKPFTSAAGESTVVFEGRTMSIRFGDKVAGRLDIKHLVTNGELGHIDYEIVDPAGKTVRTKTALQAGWGHPHHVRSFTTR